MWSIWFCKKETGILARQVNVSPPAGHEPHHAPLPSPSLFSGIIGKGWHQRSFPGTREETIRTMSILIHSASNVTRHALRESHDKLPERRFRISPIQSSLVPHGKRSPRIWAELLLNTYSNHKSGFCSRHPPHGLSREGRTQTVRPLPRMATLSSRGTLFCG